MKQGVIPRFMAQSFASFHFRIVIEFLYFIAVSSSFVGPYKSFAAG